MSPIEFRTRRKMLGLNQEEMGRCIALVSPLPDGSERPPVRQNTVARWETKQGLPEWADQTMQGIFDKIQLVGINMEESLTILADALLDQPNAFNSITLPAYPSDEEFWEALPEWEGWPATMWNIAAVRVADRLMGEHNRTIILDTPNNEE